MSDEPAVSFVVVEGMRLAVHEWNRPESAGDRPPLVLIHGTGLCARVWDPVVAALPADRRVLAIDLHGHGLSECPEPIPERFQWRRFGEDVAAVLRALDIIDVVLVGHSMGGHTAVVAAVEAPERVGRLVLLDPTLGVTSAPPGPLPPPASEHPARKRRGTWPSPEAFMANLREKTIFRTWPESVLGAYAHHGLRRTDDGTFVLACPALFEASIYAGNQMNSLEAEVPMVTAPVNVVRGRDRHPDDPPGLGPSATDIGTIRRFQDVTDRQLPGAGHFFPLEHPELTAIEIALAISGGR